jgi:altronate dehydratase
LFKKDVSDIMDINIGTIIDGEENHFTQAGERILDYVSK